MMNTNELEKILQASLDDFKLDQDEKQTFRQLAQTLSDEQRRFIQNKAFDLSKPFIRQGDDTSIRVLNWLERVIKAIQMPVNSHTIINKAFFSPGKQCRDEIIRLINASKQTIDICVFTISDNKITQAILTAHQRGVRVRIITDNDKANDKGSDVYRMAKEGVDVIYDRSSHHMHHKFTLFDEQWLLNGSFNWTLSASNYNEENLIVTSEPDLVTQFKQIFSHLQNKFKK